LNLPNLLTLIRIILTPLLVILLIDGKFVEALIVFTIAGITDGLDGLIDRVWCLDNISVSGWSGNPPIYAWQDYYSSPIGDYFYGPRKS
jgi:hypothetical protein